MTCDTFPCYCICRLNFQKPRSSVCFFFISEWEMAEVTMWATSKKPCCSLEHTM